MASQLNGVYATIIIFVFVLYCLFEAFEELCDIQFTFESIEGSLVIPFKSERGLILLVCKRFRKKATTRKQ